MELLDLSDYAGGIWDVDDTIIWNRQSELGTGLHERSRLTALRTVGVTENIPELVALPEEANNVAFNNAREHCVEAAFWWLLEKAGLVTEADAYNPKHKLINQLVDAKLAAYNDLLAAEGQAVPGAYTFIKAVHDFKPAPFEGRMANASTAHRSSIDAF